MRALDAGSAFQVNSATFERAAATAAAELPPVKDVDHHKDENLLVIPLSREIPPDFALIGYDDTIRHIEEVLSQGGKRRNVLLFGDNGTGKTAVTQGFVQRKNARNLSMHMYKRTFWRLNTTCLLHTEMADGTDDVAQINRQFNLAINELGRYDVLVIENFYSFIMYLKTKGANYILVTFLEALSRRKFQSIITCNTREKTLLQNEVPEVHEFFTPEQLSEPNNDDLLNILRGVRKSYEERYEVAIPDDTVRTIRDLTQKYRNGFEEWAQPGRALVLLERAISQFSVQMNSKPPELITLENEANNANNEIQSLVDSTEEDDIDRKEELAARLQEIEPRLTVLRQEWDKHTAPIRDLQVRKAEFVHRHRIYSQKVAALQILRGNTEQLLAKETDASTVGDEISKLTNMLVIVDAELRCITSELGKINLSKERNHRVTSEDIARTCSEISRIPLKKLTENERERVMNMESILGQRVFGQPEAVALVANAVRRARAGLSEDEGTPRGSFLFLGPSGVGKTELSKALAEFETGSDLNAIRIDMSEFMTKESVARLIGAPPGYAGYDAGGVLTEAVRAHPKSVITFDEIEKAHRDVFKVLLQVLGEGCLTDGKGNKADFKETYVVMTSNAGGEHFLNPELTYEEASVCANAEVDKILLPEIRGRLDSIICFRRLNLDMLVKVAQRRFANINKRLHAKRLQLEINDVDAKSFCTAYQDPRYGARSILKALKITLEKDLAQVILARTGGAGKFLASFSPPLFALKFEPAPASVRRHAC